MSCALALNWLLFMVRLEAPETAPKVIEVSPRVLACRFRRSTDWRFTTTGRMERVWGQMGVSVRTSASGLTMAPPAARE